MASFDVYDLPLPYVASGEAFYTGLNSSGTVVGYIVSKAHFAAFEDEKGVLSVTDSPPNTSISATGVNSAGTIVGLSVGLPRTSIFEIVNGTYLLQPTPASGQIYNVKGVNDAGAVVGTLEEDDGTHDGFIYRNGTYSRVVIAGATTTTLTAISNTGAVAGYATHADGSITSFTDTNGVIKPVVFPGSSYTIATGMNSAETVVGYYEDGSLDASGAANAFGFIYAGGVYTKITRSGSSDVELHGITDTGAMLGEEYDSAAHVERPFIIMPHGVAAPTGQLSSTLSFDSTGAATSDVQFDRYGNVAVRTTYGTTGQSYTGTSFTYDPPTRKLISARYTGVKNQSYGEFETDYASGIVAQTKYFTTGITGRSYTTETLTVSAAGQQTAVAFGGITSGPYSAYGYDYNAGLLAGSKFTVTAVPAGATYSSYETDYNFASSYLGARFFTPGITGQGYTGEEVDTDAAGATIKVLLTGFTGQPYQTLELDYTAGVLKSYKTFATGIPSQSYTGLEVDASAAGQLTKVVYTGLKNTPYTTLEQDYASGALASSTYTFNAPAGQSYSSYSVTQNAAGAQLSETVNNTDGSHTILGSSPNLIFEAIGNDLITGGGSGETFDFSTVFGHDTITDFAGHATGAGHDTISLSTADFTNFASVYASAQNVSGGVAFTGHSGSQLTLLGLDKTALAGLGADFTFRT